MSRALRAFLVLSGVTLAGLLTWQATDAEATSPGLMWTTAPGGIVCPPTWLPSSPIVCQSTGDLSDYSSVLVEVDSTTPVYFCGNNQNPDAGGVVGSQAATSCVKRCTSAASCPGGASFAIEVKRGGGGVCWSGSSTDAGVAARVQCLR